MRSMHAFIIGLGLLASCGKKKDAPAAGSASGSGMTATGSAPTNCPPGNVVKDNACVAIITPEKVQAVAQQQTRLEDLAKLLDKVDTLAAPVELMHGFFQLEEWKKIAVTDELKALDKGVAILSDAVAQLRAFKGGLGETAARLGNLKGELERLLSEPGNARKIEEVRAQVSSQIKTAIEPLLAQTIDAIQKGIQPLKLKLTDAGDLLTGVCVLARSSNDKVKTFCAAAKTAFTEAQTFLGSVEQKPKQLFDDVTRQLTTQLDALIDEQTKALLDGAQVKVNEALKLPAAGSGSAGSGSGSAP